MGGSGCDRSGGNGCVGDGEAGAGVASLLG
jgi:hypothetical protein